MKISFKKLGQRGVLSLHILLPAVLVVASIGGIGAYVLQKSKAASTTQVYCSAVTPTYWTIGAAITIKWSCANYSSKRQYINFLGLNYYDSSQAKFCSISFKRGTSVAYGYTYNTYVNASSSRTITINGTVGNCASGYYKFNSISVDAFSSSTPVRAGVKSGSTQYVSIDK